ncbi:putative NADH pyrophosphatase [Fusarium oxysporum f. sp. albedinis]|nr:putative NADH pyrophosphatase [Fusarium oxysporum f. sp. albedinis]
MACSSCIRWTQCFLSLDHPVKCSTRPRLKGEVPQLKISYHGAYTSPSKRLEMVVTSMLKGLRSLGNGSLRNLLLALSPTGRKYV